MYVSVQRVKNNQDDLEPIPIRIFKASNHPYLAKFNNRFQSMFFEFSTPLRQFIIPSLKIFIH